jgi:hypothetical protein
MCIEIQQRLIYQEQKQQLKKSVDWLWQAHSEMGLKHAGQYPLCRLLVAIMTQLDTGPHGSNIQMLFLDIVLRRYLLWSYLHHECDKWPGWREILDDFRLERVDDYSLEALSPINEHDCETMTANHIQEKVEAYQLPEVDPVYPPEADGT